MHQGVEFACWHSSFVFQVTKWCKLLTYLISPNFKVDASTQTLIKATDNSVFFIIWWIFKSNLKIHYYIKTCLYSTQFYGVYESRRDASKPDMVRALNSSVSFKSEAARFPHSYTVHMIRRRQCLMGCHSNTTHSGLWAVELAWFNWQPEAASGVDLTCGFCSRSC